MLRIVSYDLEITNHCTNGCKFCPHGSMTRPRGFMDIETFKMAMALARRSTALVTISGMGDPLSHPRLFDYIEILSQSGLKFGLVINPKGLLRDRSALSRLRDSRVPSVTISFPSTRKGVFEALLPGCTFDAALELTLALHASIKAHGGILRVQGILTSWNRDEGRQYLDFWAGLGIKAWVRQCHSRGGHLKNGLNIAKVKRGHGACWLHEVHGFIAWNGELLACCHDFTGESRWGHVRFDGQRCVPGICNRNKKWPYFAACKGCDEEFRVPPRRIKKGLGRFLINNKMYDRGEERS